MGELLQDLESLTFFEDANFWVWGNDSSTIYLVSLAYKYLYMRANVVDDRSEDIVQLCARVLVSSQGKCLLLAAALG